MTYLFFNGRSPHDLAKDSGAKDPNDPGLTEADRKVSEAMMDMWIQFARTGDPNVEGMIEWPVYNKENDQYRYIADPLDIKTGFSEIKPEATPAQSDNTPIEEKAE